MSLHLCAPTGHEARRHHHGGVAPEPARPDPDVAGEAPARRRPGRRQLHRRGGAAGGEVAASRAWRRSARRRAPSTPGSTILASEIEDHPENQTRFVIVGLRHPRADRPRQDVGRVLPAPGPPGLAARDPPGVRGARDQPHQARVAPDEAEPRRLLLLHRLRGPHRRRARRRLPAQPRGEAGAGEVPRLVPGRGRRRARAPAGRDQGVARRRRVGRRAARRRSATRTDDARDRPASACATSPSTARGSSASASRRA